MNGSNIEIKARVSDREALLECIRAGGAENQGTLHQRDTFYRDAEARLKLRRIAGRGAELIRYSRPDHAGPKRSSYTIRPVRFRALLDLWLRLTRGLVGEVSKQRELWLWRGVRIHLDRVEGLGDFIELEAVVGVIGDEAEAELRCAELMRMLEISDHDLVTAAYIDLLRVGQEPESAA